MTTDLVMVLWSVALTFVLAMIAGIGATQQIGVAGNAGNRENVPPITGWPGRAQRAHRNMVENLPLFVALVLIAHIARRTDEMVVLGSEIFFAARVAHAFIYIAGIPWIRTVAFAVSVAGLGLIFLQLL